MGGNDAITFKARYFAMIGWSAIDNRESVSLAEFNCSSRCDSRGGCEREVRLICCSEAKAAAINFDCLVDELSSVRVGAALPSTSSRFSSATFGLPDDVPAVVVYEQRWENLAIFRILLHRNIIHWTMNYSLKVVRNMIIVSWPPVSWTARYCVPYFEEYQTYERLRDYSHEDEINVSSSNSHTSGIRSFSYATLPIVFLKEIFSTIFQRRQQNLERKRKKIDITQQERKSYGIISSACKK
jgi:hypothetical protein